MSNFGYFVGFILLVATIFVVLIHRKFTIGEKSNFIEKIFSFLYIWLLVVILYMFTFVFSYNIYWNKSFRAINENKYEAEVVSYKQEISQTQNFRKSTYYDVIIYYPIVKYKDKNNIMKTKTLDMTSNHPFKIGDKIYVTDTNNQNNVNNLDVNWILFSVV